MFVPGQRLEGVNSMADVASLMQRATKNRSTFATNMNDHSSRSHLVLTLLAVATQRTKGGWVARGILQRLQ